MKASQAGAGVLARALLPSPTKRLHAREPMLEPDTRDNKLIDELLLHLLSIQEQVKNYGGRVSAPTGSGLVVKSDREFMAHYEIS